ncbi:SUMF1/EgtB/PvdO family nonheme iron enzyme [Rhodocytophaga aerolata]|uniref:SUMF1/EgtB/PvdO family nonheme iron enzyme n=1 Tax=Rhodocytophaga aerolata TaxID=455078 RepID=A0ABT8RHA6_9BACT|nr:SUMF1/EgtB/PvdO family nonheme iron enzyme [Rhodocytophaga aerolata]MDO1451492.1 SUMF1/EgtB/PvdO family nonheme iron enzyme [Rhodocytophaga aerolata]
MNLIKPEVAINDLMVEIPNGTIQLRDDRTKQKWIVEIKPFLLTKFPVTQDLYFEVIKENPSTFKGNRRPVETVTWQESVIFCNVLSCLNNLSSCYSFCKHTDEVLFDQTANGFRLPTEAEWEYACRAGTSGIRYGELDHIAWYKNNSQESTQVVGQKEPNRWGLYDMLGNVWEWCSDIYDPQVYGSYRIFRGGGWCDEHRGVMASTRRRSHPTKFKIDDLGFRIARNKH